MMTVLATRMITGRDNDGNALAVSVVIAMPFEASPSDWRCILALEPPVIKANAYGTGGDFLGALLQALGFARMYLEYARPTQGGHWQGLHDFGLPCREEKPSTYQPVEIPSLEPLRDDAPVLATRDLACPDENGVERAITFTVFVPYEAADGSWMCGFTFEALPVPAVFHGKGADFIEALLDACSIARLVFESKVPKGWMMTLDLLNCFDFPYKIGRSYRDDAPRVSSVVE